jgi:hypothetical protein
LGASEDSYSPETPDDLYADVIRGLDWSIGQILSRVNQLGIADNTMVLFLSDIAHTCDEITHRPCRVLDLSIPTAACGVGTAYEPILS